MGCGASSVQAPNQNGIQQQQQQQYQQQQQQQQYNNYSKQQPLINNNNQHVPVPILQPQNTPITPTAPPPEVPRKATPPPVRNEPPPLVQQQHPPVLQESTEIDTPLPEVVPLQAEPIEKEPPIVEVTPELLSEFVELEKQIRLLEINRSEEKLLLHQIEYKNVNAACSSLRAELEQLKLISLKEYEDVAHFDLVAYMVKNEINVMADSENLDENKKKEEYEYFEAKNKQDITERQIKSLETQLNQINHNIEECKKEAALLADLRIKVDGLLENIFNGEYGSDLEERLELEAEQLLQLKKHLSLAHYKWWNGRQLLHHACSQIAYAVRRWMQIQEVAYHDGQAKYHMITDTRNNMIACHQNLQRASGYLNIQLPYWSDGDDKNIVSSINVIYNDIKTTHSYQKALQWYRYYHWRLALLLNWMDQVINNKIVADHHRVSRDYRDKYKELRVERLNCIKAKVKEVLNIDLDIDQFSKENEADDENEDDFLPKVESNMAVNADSFVPEGEENDMPPATDAENDPTLHESIVKESGTFRAISMGTSMETTTETTESGTDSMAMQTTETGTDSLPVQTSEMGIGTDPPAVNTTEMSTGMETQADPQSAQDTAPAVKLIPLSDLAPPPSDDLLFGNVEQLQLIHRQQIEEFEKVQESNKNRQQQGLQEKLRKRQNKRRKQQMQEEQEKALASPKTD